MTSREDSVLAARDPSLADENDWEEFSLSEVRVLVPGKSRYANLLTASPDNPVQVTGCLDEVEEEQESLVLDQDYLTKRIVLENITHYAYGQHDDGEVGIWVAGRAGWFSISPARGYRPMFNDVVEAIDLLYFLADRHQKRRRSKRRNRTPSVEYLCEEYVSHTHGICEDNDDSAEVFYKHHHFLLTRMLKGEEGIQWVDTDIFAHLREKFPDYEQIKAELESPKAESEPEEDKADDEPEEATHEPDPTAVSKTQTEAIYQVILDLKEAGHLAKRQLNLDLVASTIVGRFEIDSADYAQDLIASKADAIIELMDEAKTYNFDWSRKVIYRELKAAAKKHDVQQIAFTPLRPRLFNEAESSPEDSEHEEEQPRPRRRRVRKSVLRPKSTIASKKIGKRTRSAAAADDEYLSDDNPDAMDEFETPSKVRGHELVRDPLSTRAKRRTRSMLSNPETTPLQKVPALQEILQSRNTSVSIGDQAPSEPDTLNGNESTSDTWFCQARGCDKVIHRSNTKHGKELIRVHSLEHADDAKVKMDLVLSEHQLNIGFRVDNLLDHIRGMGCLDIAAMDGTTNGTNGIGA
ncbi:hypothetical protein F9C07_9016 [Aspergillus flavus]|uniref:RFTS domain-containing protein n=1 Tax=Aspergillus flavus (strain ATCC 200026 / FGSC A1120 / IAM 13836 / NRRL 3357 / JCM 12722 / SRRC 167) TaxID=332952 RepID=A0A7U2QVV2_ASPFN|nr:hypothetical protein F9C07_9016 [Aspergillus flavus]